MPTVLTIGSYRFFFYSSDSKEPVPIHIQEGASLAKFWIDPLRLASSKGFSPSKLRVLAELTAENAEIIRRSWNEFFGS